jgi:hypothetical protein
MTRLTVLVCVVILVVSVSTGASAAPAKKKLVRCAPKHTRIIVSNSQVEVYEGPDPHREGLPAIYGCARPRHRPYVLGERLYFSSSGGGGIQRETLAGTIVAYEQTGADELPKG